jgi:nitroreductase
VPTPKAGVMAMRRNRSGTTTSGVESGSAPRKLAALRTRRDGGRTARRVDIFETVRMRRSVRVFIPQDVDADQIRTILAVANRAPSAGNLQAYEIYVVVDRSARARLRHAALDQPDITEAPVALVFCARPERSAARYGTRGRELFSVQDATIACAYAQLAVAALDLGSVWIGAFDEDVVRRALGLGAALRPVAILPIGHAGEKPAATPRRALTSLAHYITAPQQLPSTVDVRVPTTGLERPSQG